MLRVGRRIYDKKGKFTDPSYPNFTTIIVMTKSASIYGDIGPYELCDDDHRIMENIWQASKVYNTIPSNTSYQSRYTNLIVWQHDAETHIDPKTNEITKEYWNWRKKLENNKYPVRYPVGYNHRHNCKFALADIGNGKYSKPLNYIEGRKMIYVPLYTKLVKKTNNFKKLQTRLNNGENLLIVEVDGPHQEALKYYKGKYNVNDDFIEKDTMLINEQNINIMLNDEKYPFGHGYCLAMALLDKENEWNK